MGEEVQGHQVAWGEMTEEKTKLLKAETETDTEAQQRRW